MSKCSECGGNIPGPGVICEDCYTEVLENRLRANVDETEESAKDTETRYGPMLERLGQEKEPTTTNTATITPDFKLGSQIGHTQALREVKEWVKKNNQDILEDSGGPHYCNASALKAKLEEMLANG